MTEQGQGQIYPEGASGILKPREREIEMEIMSISDSARAQIAKCVKAGLSQMVFRTEQSTVW